MKMETKNKNKKCSTENVTETLKTLRHYFIAPECKYVAGHCIQRYIK
jgi:hypothetical protein